MPSKKATRQRKSGWLAPAKLGKLLPHRDPRGHKNTFGHLLLIGGAPGSVGAIVLSTQAALRTGVGLVTTATGPDSFAVLQCKLPVEAMSAELTSLPQTKSYSALAIGPGWGTGVIQKQVFQSLLQDARFAAVPWVLDADALNLIAQNGWQTAIQARKAPTVITPHPAELARLLGCTVEQVLAHPMASARKASHALASVTVLKGAETWIVAPDAGSALGLDAPNDGLAKGGSGDVLTGLLGGLLATCTDVTQNATQIAQLAVGIHSLAGETAANAMGRRSMTAGDLVSALAPVFQALAARGPNSSGQRR